MIPKRIFEIWISDKPMPEKFLQYTKTWAINKGFDIIPVRKCNYHSPFLQYAIRENKHTLVNHYLRCKLLHEFGGVYLDLDVECNKPLDSLLKEPLVIGIEDRYIVNNAIILSEKGHPFLKHCLDYMDSFQFDSKDVELETGPRLFTNVAKKFYGWKENHSGYFTQAKEDFRNHKYIRILSPEHFYPYHYSEAYKETCVKKNTFCTHHWNQSWNDLVSIIIPCYKQAHYLDDAIKSALAQTYKNIEVIVINDGSPDNTSEVARKYPSVKLIEQKNKGLSAARNIGIEKSIGKWILPLDADDKLLPNFIMRTIFQADIVSTYLKTFGTREDVWKPKLVHPKYSDLLIHNQLHYCSLFKREVWEKKKYDEEMFVNGKMGCNGYEDWNFWLDASKNGYSIRVIPEVLIRYRKQGFSMVDDAMKNHKKIVSYMKLFHPLIKQ